MKKTAYTLAALLLAGASFTASAAPSDVSEGTVVAATAGAAVLVAGTVALMTGGGDGNPNSSTSTSTTTSTR